MRHLIKTLAIVFSILLISCGGGDEKKKEKIKIGQKPAVETKANASLHF